jgi:hypothetical protein
MKRKYVYFSCLLLAASAVSGCTSSATSSSAASVRSGDSGGSTQPPDSVAGSEVQGTATSDSLSPAVTSLTEQPGSADDDFVGAAKDVTLESCGLSDGKWKAKGTVANTSGAAAKYRIYIALNAPGTTDTKAVVQVDVDVADGKTEKWTAEANLATPELQCILRVERAKA